MVFPFHRMGVRQHGVPATGRHRGTVRLQGKEVPERRGGMTKDEYIAYLEAKNKEFWKEIQKLSYEKGELLGRLSVWYERFPGLGMEIIPGGKFKELKRKGGAQ